MIGSDGQTSVLIVDDNVSVLAVLARWLTEGGYDVTACRSYEDARDFLLTHAPDVIITDVRLGAFNGLQLAIVARERDRDTILIVLSGFDDPSIRQQAEAIGATFLIKPFARDDFFALLPPARPAATGAAPEP